MRRFLVWAGTPFLFALFAAGCASTTGSGYHDHHFDFSRIKRVAVVAVEGASGAGDRQQAVQNQIGDMFNQALRDEAYSPVARTRIQAVMRTQGFPRPEAANVSGAAKFGRILNVDAAVIINVPAYGHTMKMRARMVDVTTATVIWDASGSAQVGEDSGAPVGAGSSANAMTRQRRQQAAKLIKTLFESLPESG